MRHPPGSIPRVPWPSLDAALSTGVACERLLAAWLQDPALAARIVRIGADPAPHGQTGEDRALAEWTAAATSHAVRGVPLLPVYIRHGMRGLQHVGDAVVAAAEQRARGFLVDAQPGLDAPDGGAPARRHGTGHLFASTLAACRAYDPAFAGELAVILEHGMRSMLLDPDDAFYYLTLSDAHATAPALAAPPSGDVLRGMYLLQPGPPGTRRVQLLGGGALMGQVLEAAALLAHTHGIAADVWSITSYTELAREAQAQERGWREGTRAAVDSWFAQQLAASAGPIVAATACERALPELLRAFTPPGRRYLTLGAEGFGHSSTRHDADVGAAAIVQAACRAVDDGMSAQAAIDQRRLADVIALASI